MEEIGRLSSREIVYWLAYFRLDPWGEERADVRAGVMALSALTPWRGKDAEALEPLDLLPDWSGERAERKRREKNEGMVAWIKAMSGAGEGE